MKILIVAGTFEQAREYARALGLLRNTWDYAASADGLRGTRFQTVIFCGTYRDRSDYQDIMEMSYISGQDGNLLHIEDMRRWGRRWR